MLRFKKLFFSFVLFTGCVVFLFQNCSQFGNSDSDKSSSTLGSSISDAGHMVEDKLAPPQQQVRLGNRRFITEMFRDIFTADDGTPAPKLYELTFRWSDRRGAQFGGGCDPLDSLTGQDCNGDVTGSNMPAFNDPSAIRESFVIQLCDEFLGQNAALAIPLAKIGVDIASPNEPNIEKIKLAYALFYRSDEAPTYYTSNLSQFKTDLKARGETNLEAWRGIFSIICESPDWQKL